MLTKKNMERLTTKRLLAYLKSQRRELFGFRVGWDDWACDMPIGFDPKEKALQDQHDLTKEVLAKRENVI